jgi:hypothetical protein
MMKREYNVNIFKNYQKETLLFYIIALFVSIKHIRILLNYNIYDILSQQSF